MAELSKDSAGNSSPEARLEYLKSRGVEVETVEDREKAKSEVVGIAEIVKQLQRKVDDGEVIEGTEFALIPHDASKPIRSVFLPPQLTAGDNLPNFCKPYFADSNSIDVNLLNQQATKQFSSGQLSGMDPSNISASAMNKVAAQGSVETFPLVHPGSTNKYCGVYIYLDEVGMLKKLPPNLRASQIATSCGYAPPPNFYGDVFIGRVQTKPSMSNVNFKVGEDTDPGSTWMRRAVQENVDWQQEMNKVTNRTGELQPMKDGEGGVAKDEEGYSWTQDSEEVEIVINFPSPVDKKKVKVKCKQKSILVTYDSVTKLDLQLYEAIDVDGMAWTCGSDAKGHMLTITVEKGEGGVSWPRVTK
ncbi:hypothetical protein TrLO_g12830 [Triparma laevis f. longispina]|uniref:NudC domain-containing protein 1 n=1 Tax=Triparma laevis f. longispina TaxID=1714387 RepID=A0A9W7EH06_9STRA|nr:hypothetical protein TrLO_g12830 [Triparma laevis f. longispina]